MLSELVLDKMKINGKEVLILVLMDNALRAQKIKVIIYQ